MAINSVSQSIVCFGFFSIFLCIITWVSDIVGWVAACPYCQVERSVIGLLGIILVLPYKRFLSLMFAGLFAFVGLNVASNHLFMHFKNASYSLNNTPLIIAALCIITLQISLIVAKSNTYQNQRYFNPYG